MNFVTGGTGFVGSHLVRALLERGEGVRCLVRPSSRRDNLEGLGVEIHVGDLADPESLEGALDGVGTLYHCAADYRLGAPKPEELYRHNVDGTDHLFQAAADAGVERVVYTSSVGALGLLPGEQSSDEDTPVSLEKVVGHYKRSKFLAERAAEAWAEKGLPVVIVNPSTPIGERDIKPTPTGQIIVDFLNRKIPAYVETGLNLIDVRDVAQGHLLAAERGKVGEKYILGNLNLTLKEILDRLSELTGLPAPRVRLPHWIPFTAAAFDTGLSRVFGRTPKISLESVRMARYKMFFDSSKALKELDLPQTPVEKPLKRAVDWFREHGYAP